jgi:ectoine hydroxylase
MRTDDYPTRIDGVCQILPREDPVVYPAESDAGGPLTPEQTADYEKNGFLYFESFLDRDEVAALQTEMDEMRVAEAVRQSELAVNEPTTGETRSVFAVQTVSELMHNLVADQRLLGMVRQLLGSDAYLHQTRLNFKPGFRGKEFYWHSDFETWHAEDGMPRMRAVSCSIALSDNFAYNGPLMLIPGSHQHFCQCQGWTPDAHYQQSISKQDLGVPSDEQLEWLTKAGGIAAPTGPAGSIVLYDCNTMHGSNGNITPYPRFNLFVAYNSVANTLAEPFAAEEPRPWYYGQRDVEPLEPVDFRSTLDQLSAKTA